MLYIPFNVSRETFLKTLCIVSRETMFAVDVKERVSVSF
nr:MAG TPA: hypothetical protein [Caudoviricetes sp.]